MKDEDIVMTLLESLPPSYEYLITALETLPMQAFTMEFVTARLMHEMSKRREKEPQGEDAAMVSTQGRGGTTSTRKDTKIYWKQLENKQEMEHSRFIEWNNCIN